MKFKDFITLKRGYDLPENEREKGQFMIYSANGGLDKHKEFKCKGPGVITGRSGTIGEVMYTERPYWPLNTTLYVENFNNNSPCFVYYFLKNMNLKRFSTGAVVPTLNKNHLDLLDIDIPSYEIQLRITNILGSLDKKIEINQKKIAELEKTAKLIYDYWFVQFDFPDENGKPYKSSGGKMVYNEVLKQRIPKNWDYVQGKSVFRFEKGKIPSKLFNVPEITMSPYITIEVANGQSPQYCFKDNLPYCNGETIMVMDGAASGDLYNGNYGVLGSTFSLLKPLRKDISNAFIYILLNGNKSRYLIANTGSTVPHANRKFIENMWFTLPKDASKFSVLFSNIFESISIYKEQNKELIKCRDWLLPMLMNGQVTIED